MNFPEYNLNLVIEKNSANSAIITLQNTKYSESKSKTILWIAFTVVLYVGYFLALNDKHLLVHGAFFVILMLLLVQLSNLVDKEMLNVVKNFGIEQSTVLCFGRSRSTFIPINNIHKIVLNEVIYFVSTQAIDAISVMLKIPLKTEPRDICAATSY